MKTRLDGNLLTVTREPGDRRLYKETEFFHALKVVLNKQGHDLVKKDMQSDGHLCSPGYYLRDRKWKYCFVDQDAVIRDVSKEFRRIGEVDLYRVNL